MTASSDCTNSSRPEAGDTPRPNADVASLSYLTTSFTIGKGKAVAFLTRTLYTHVSYPGLSHARNPAGPQLLPLKPSPPKPAGMRRRPVRRSVAKQGLGGSTRPVTRLA